MMFVVDKKQNENGETKFIHKNVSKCDIDRDTYLIYID